MGCGSSKVRDTPKREKRTSIFSLPTSENEKNDRKGSMSLSGQNTKSDTKKGTENILIMNNYPPKAVSSSKFERVSVPTTIHLQGAKQGVGLKHKNHLDTHLDEKQENRKNSYSDTKRMLSYIAKLKKADITLLFKNIAHDYDIISKSHSIHTLDNKLFEYVNFNVKKLTHYYKNQTVVIDGMKPFVDKLFPPNSNSIFSKKKNGTYIDPFDERRNKYLKDFPLKEEDTIWLRAKDIFEGGKYTIFANDIDIDDVQQGSIGNCYFMSSLAALAWNPQLICQLFKNFQVPENGCYEIGLQIDGKWKIVLLDDYFPCFKKTKRPIFAKPRGAELWVMLLEKAWAKVNGGYLNITGGWATEVLSALTPFPIEYTPHKRFSYEDLWSKIKKDYDLGYIMACCSRFNAEIESYGLIPGHAFTLVAAKEIRINERNIKMIKLRNPWGYREWNGPWSDNSPLWTEDAIFAIQDFESKTDGVFWMEFSDFLKFFIVTESCKFSSPQCVKHISISQNHADLPNVFEMHVFKNSIIDICAIKKNYRFHRTIPPDAELTINLLLAKINEKGQIEYISSHNEDLANPLIEVELNMGYYLIYVYANYLYSTFDKIRKYQLQISSNAFFDIFEKGIDKDFSLLREIIHNRIETASLNDESFFTKEENLLEVSHHKFESTTFGFIYLQNIDKDPQTLTLIDETQNFELLGPHNSAFFDNNAKINLILASDESIIIVGMRKNYYEKCCFHVNYEKIENKSTNIYKIEKNNILHFKKNLPDKPLDEDNYDFIFKKVEFDINKIIEKIDHVEIAKNYFSAKYPKEVKDILTVPSLNDNEEIIFRDIYDFGDSIYLGEWKVKEEFIRHGRGWFVWSDGSSYLGQFENDKFEGSGTFNFINGDKIQIYFKDGSMHGKGIYTTTEGQTHEVTYNEGHLVE